MLKTLGPGAIGIKDLALPDAIALARETGFDAITFDIREAATLAADHGPNHVRALFADAGIVPGSWNAPVSYRDDDRYQTDLEALPRFAALGRDLGCVRATSGVAPGSNDREYAANWDWHVERLRPIAQILADSGVRLGFEFIGPKTFRAQFAHEFVYSMAGMMELATALGTGNAGILLDIWHLYTAGESITDLERLSAADIVAVHVNDAPAGIPRDEQQDLVRALPLETGVLDLAGFMAALRQLGYDGPVMPEPFSQRITDLAATDPTAAARETAHAMDALWSVAGLG